MSCCRLCKEYDREAKLIRYARRHHVHPACAFKRWGATFFDRLTTYQLEQRLPYRVVVDAGLERELEQTLAQRKRTGAL